MLRSPSAVEGQGGATSVEQKKASGSMLMLRDQMASLAAENGLKVPDALLPTVTTSESTGAGSHGTGADNLRTVVRDNLLPTPNTMDSIAPRSEEARERQLRRGDPDGPMRSSTGNLREDILTLLPTTTATDSKGSRSLTVLDANGNKRPNAGATLNDLVFDGSLLPTTAARDYKDGHTERIRDGKVATDTVSRAILNGGEVENAGVTSWGKYQPAIRRWETVLGRPAPSPTLPDGKDGTHRLSSRFAEWMMGLPDGWITDAGVGRTAELKLAGNGVVPQQASLALTRLLSMPR